MIHGELIRLSGVFRSFPAEGRQREVLRNLDFRLHAGTVVGIRGSSGSGKTTLARVLAGLDTGFSGTRFVNPALHAQSVQMVFQDSLQSFNPRLKLAVSLQEALVARGRAKWLRGRTEEARSVLHHALTEVGLEPHLLERTPGRLSGGQRQRAAIARALCMSPAVLVLDEPVAALDLSIQARILNVLQRVRIDHEISLVIVSHDPGVLLHMTDQVYRLEEGRLWRET
jgi:peptide/nickel transport system ATP-binding protein